MLIAFPELVAQVRADLRCLSAEQAMAEIQSNGGILIDVRETAEVQANPAPLSVSLPRGILELKVQEFVSDPGHPVYVHCATGGRATMAAEQLQRLGFQRVTVITCPIATLCEQQEKQ